jgi:hypothetical protein
MYAGRHFLPEFMRIIPADINKAVIYAVSDVWVTEHYRPRFPLNLSWCLNGEFLVIRSNNEGKALLKSARG